jgi:hypothetical protein
VLKVRNLVIIVLIIGVIYAVAPPERKRRWLDRFREFGRAIALSLVIYWIYMIARFLYQRS